MTDYLDVKRTADELEGLASEVDRVSIAAARRAIKVVRDNVLNFTPRYTGESQAKILTREEDGGRTQVVYTDHVVNKVMEGNPPAFWSKPPPFAPLKQWAELKLGLPPKDAGRVAAIVRRKIRWFGLRLPLKADGRGMMFRRTWELMEATRFHLIAFVSAAKQLLRRA